MKLFKTQRDFSLALFSALFGFLVANVFGTFLTALRNYVKWDGFIIFGLVVCIECINVIVYSVNVHRNRNLFQNSFRFVGFKLAPFSSEGKKPFHYTSRQNIIYQLIKNFKLGLLLGFFVEAFKVGS